MVLNQQVHKDFQQMVPIAIWDEINQGKASNSEGLVDELGRRLQGMTATPT